MFLFYCKLVLMSVTDKKIKKKLKRTGVKFGSKKYTPNEVRPKKEVTYLMIF